MRRRLDRELVRRGLAPDPSEARRAIEEGLVTVGGMPSPGPGTMVAPDDPVALRGEAAPFASRGGDKLAAALDRFRIDPAGRSCLDAGASTGGFTDVLLSRGAAAVVAVDVGYGQLAWSLRTDPRVTVMERTNVRRIRPDDLPFAPGLVAADLSFISLASVVPALARVAAPEADHVLLVKPQFEAEPGVVEEGGVVRDPDVWAACIARVAEACRAEGLGPLGVAPSPLRGPAGNVEFFLHARGSGTGADLDLAEAIAEAAR